MHNAYITLVSYLNYAYITAYIMNDIICTRNAMKRCILNLVPKDVDLTDEEHRDFVVYTMQKLG